MTILHSSNDQKQKAALPPFAGPRSPNSEAAEFEIRHKHKMYFFIVAAVNFRENETGTNFSVSEPPRAK